MLERGQKTLMDFRSPDASEQQDGLKTTGLGLAPGREQGLQDFFLLLLFSADSLFARKKCHSRAPKLSVDSSQV